MDIQSYLIQKETREKQKFQYRNICDECRQPGFSCYCQHVKKFDPNIKFVILMHPIERRRRIATGRMAYLSLQDSEIIYGQDFGSDARLNSILENKNYNCVVMCPGAGAVNLTNSTSEVKQSLFVEGKKTVIIVIDGTWATAKKMMNRSPNLKKMQKICFSPPGPSRFRVRKQPSAECYSTIEAIHHTIELVGDYAGFVTASSAHDSLLYVFDKMVERQLEFMKDAFNNPNTTSYRKVKKKVA